MSASPNRLRPAKAHVGRAGGLDVSDEPPQFLDADGHEGCSVNHAAGDRLLLFALSEATAICVSFKRARNPARNAKASIDSVMCRCQPCQERASQWSSPVSPLADWKHSSIVHRSPATAASSCNS